MASFRTTYILEGTKEEREIKKELPFTVTPIGGKDELKVWKAEYARKQMEWDSKAPERYAIAKARAINVLNGTAAPSVTFYTESSKKASEAFANLSTLATRVKIKTEIQKVPWYQSLGHWILLAFLNIKFE